MNRLVLLVVLFLFPAIANAAVVAWDTNAESDIKDVQVWVCETPNCVVVKSAATLKATVPHVSNIARQSVTIDLAGKEGTVALSARDISLNESGLSVQVPFDKQAPQVPANPTVQ